jgi:hypothetical protein
MSSWTVCLTLGAPTSPAGTAERTTHAATPTAHTYNRYLYSTAPCNHPGASGALEGERTTASITEEQPVASHAFDVVSAVHVINYLDVAHTLIAF